MTDKIVVLNTCDSQDQARRIARALVEARVAACVNVVPGITSYYRWKGKMEESTEWLLLIKTRRSLLEPLTVELRKVHSYELPEVVALPIVDGLPDYLGWIDDETAAAPAV